MGAGLDVQHQNLGPPLAVGENFGAGRPAPKALGDLGGRREPFGSWTTNTEILAPRWRSGKTSVLDVQLPKGWGSGGGGGPNPLGARRPAPSGKISVLTAGSSGKGLGGGGPGPEPFGSWTSSTEIFLANNWLFSLPCFAK